MLYRMFAAMRLIYRLESVIGMNDWMFSIMLKSYMYLQLADALSWGCQSLLIAKRILGLNFYVCFTSAQSTAGLSMLHARA